MKKLIVLICLFGSFLTNAQTFTIGLDSNNQLPLSADSTIINTPNELETLVLKYPNFTSLPRSFDIVFDNDFGNKFNLPLNQEEVILTFTDGRHLTSKTIGIYNVGTNISPIIESTLINQPAATSLPVVNPAATTGSLVDSKYKSSHELVNDTFDYSFVKREGIYVNGKKDDPSYKYVGLDYVHIFLDEFGNPIISSIPQGSPDKTYVVHVLAQVEKGTRFSVKQTQGGIGDALVFRNIPSGSKPKEDIDGQSNDLFDLDYEITLRESNSDIVFEVHSGKLSDEGPLVSSLINTHTIPIKIYNGSFDIGLISSQLENPTYTFVASADDDTMGKVKKSDKGKRGIVTSMATFYSSPIILIERYLLGKKDIPAYKLTGRNFVTDHEFYERIYPALGVSLNEAALENLFFGFNIEAVRGASLFVGWHHGKVNVFDYDADDFSFGDSDISSSQFSLSTKEKWETDFAIGFNLDVLVIFNLLRQGSLSSN